jgi:hypothetical protein
MIRRFSWLLCCAALLGCSDATEVHVDGRIRIAVFTSGDPPQADEYLLTLDGERPLSVEPNGSILYDAVTEGTHVIHLFALADNCVVSGSTSPRSVQVRRGSVAEVQFTVICGPPLTGGFRVVVTSVGPLDEDGYQLSVAGSPLRSIGVNAQETYEGLTPGAHLITLKDVADFCEVIGGNPRPYTVVAGKSVQVALRVACGNPPGPA